MFFRIIMNDVFVVSFVDGVGRLTYPNGDCYCGEWKQGKMHGKVIPTIYYFDNRYILLEIKNL